MFKKKAIKKFNMELNNFIVYEKDYSGAVTKIDGKTIKGWSSPLNYKCHWNSMTTYMNNDDLEVIPCLYKFKDGDEYWAHFINRSKKTGEYFDNTQGARSRVFDYYVFENNWLDGRDKSQDNADHWLNWLREEITKLILPKIGIWKVFIKDDDIL